MVILGFLCLFISVIIAIMFAMAMAARGIAEDDEEKRNVEDEGRADGGEK